MLATPFYTYFLENLRNVEGNYLEIGVYDGDGISQLAKAYKNKRFYGIDPWIEDGNTTHITGIPKGQSLLQQEKLARRSVMFLPNVDLITRTSSEFSKTLTDDYIRQMNLSVVFVDGSHAFEDALHDLHLSLTLLRKGGWIGVDDLHLEGPRLALKEFLSFHPCKQISSCPAIFAI